MQLRRQSTGQPLTLDTTQEIGAGGEARIYPVRGDRTVVAKVSHDPTEDRARKLAAMIPNPPTDPMTAHGGVSIAWPLDLLLRPGNHQHAVGFLMPRVAGMQPLFRFYNPGERRQLDPLFSYIYLLRTARNLAAIMAALHDKGYVIGDVNESNVLVSEQALVALVDTDSFQVLDHQHGTLFRCTVGKPEFTPPELQGRIFAHVDRTPEHDRFGLAVLLFQMLLEGTHPFDGIFQGTGDPPPVGERIRAGHFPYGTRPAPYRPPLVAPPFAILPPSVQHLFLRCFEDGHGTPSVRPDAQTWRLALSVADEALATCTVNDQHRYSTHLQTCPWCERTAQLGGRDPFPSRQAVQQGRHTRPVPKRTPRPATPSPQPTPVPPRPAQPQQPAAPPSPVPTPPPVQPHRGWRRAGAIMVGLVLLTVLLPQVVAFVRRGLTPQEAQQPSATAPHAPARPAPVSPSPSPAVSISTGMVSIPAGAFFMGCNAAVDTNCFDDEKPGRTVSLDAFTIDTYEVTVANYRQCVEAGKCTALDMGGSCNWNQSNRAQHPINCMDWNQAKTYCEWQGKRLPTEAEWEKAARGTDKRVYPWGNEWDAKKANVNTSGTVAVGSYAAGISPYGAYDMSGNVWEWTADWYADVYYQNSPVRNPKGLASGNTRSVRGGSWGDRTQGARASNRYRLDPGNRSDFIGVRCAQ